MNGSKKNRKNKGSDRDHKENQFPYLSQVKKKLITTIEQKKCTIYNLQLTITDLRISYLLI